MSELRRQLARQRKKLLDCPPFYERIKVAAREFDERVDELVVAKYDNLFGFEGDTYDEQTQTKIGGFADCVKLDEWRSKMTNLYKRRLNRQHEKSADEIFFNRRQSGDLLEDDKREEDHAASREHLELLETLDQGQKLSESIEFEFATKFKDLNEMGTMVALTAGVSALDAGINRTDCVSEATRSMSSQSRLRKPQVRNALLDSISRGKTQKTLVKRKRNDRIWINQTDQKQKSLYESQLQV